jgi:hypothetical protein
MVIKIMTYIYIIHEGQIRAFGLIRVLFDEYRGGERSRKTRKK